jgi:hypothetical protein
LSKYYFVCITIFALVLVPVLAQANARLVSVTPVAAGCVSGPTGPAVQAWDVEPGETYTITVADVFECAAGGTGPTIDVRVNSSDLGNVDLVASLVSPGVYAFDFTMPLDGVCTFPIYTCTTPGVGPSGDLVIRDDGVAFQAHLRAATFEAGCINPMAILGGVCSPVPNDESSWGTLKALYN